MTGTSMLIFDGFIAMVWLPGIFFCVWVMICNNRTSEERIKVVVLAARRPVTGEDLIKAYDLVTYYQHLRALVLRRDPWLLYPPIVQDAIAHPRTEIVAGITVGASGDAPPSVH